MKPLKVRRFDGRLANFFDIHWMPKRGKGMAIVNLENLGLALANTDQKNSLWPRKGKNRGATL